MTAFPSSLEIDSESERQTQGPRAVSLHGDCASAPRPPDRAGPMDTAPAFVHKLVRQRLLAPAAAARFLGERRLADSADAAAAGHALIEAGLLTRFQLDRV